MAQTGEFKLEGWVVDVTKRARSAGELASRTVPFQGYLAESALGKEYYRLYRTATLAVYLDIPRTAILYVHPLDPAYSGLGGSIVWVKRDAVVILARELTAAMLAGTIIEDFGPGGDEDEDEDDDDDGDGVVGDPGVTTSSPPCKNL